MRWLRTSVPLAMGALLVAGPKAQTAAKKEGGTTTIAIEGRHDPCICPRVVPVAESMMAIVLANAWLRQRALRGREK